MSRETSDEFVQSFARGLDVIRAFDGDHPRMSLSEVAERTGLTRAAVRRFLLTLVSLGYVSEDGRSFRLTPRVLELGYRYLSGLSFPELAQPHLEALSRELRDSTSASVLDDSADRLPYPAGSTLYVRRAAALKHRFRYGDRVLVAHRTSERGRREFHEVLAGVLQATAGGGDVLVLTRSNNRQVPPALVVNEARRHGDAPAAEADLIILPAPDAADRVVVLGRVELATIPG